MQNKVKLDLEADGETDDRSDLVGEDIDSIYVRQHVSLAKEVE